MTPWAFLGSLPISVGGVQGIKTSFDERALYKKRDPTQRGTKHTQTIKKLMRLNLNTVLLKTFVEGGDGVIVFVKRCKILPDPLGDRELELRCGGIP